MTNCLFCKIETCEWCGVDMFIDQCPYVPEEEMSDYERANFEEYMREMEEEEEEEERFQRLARKAVMHEDA